MDYNIDLINISNTQKPFISPVSSTPIRRPLMIENGDKPKKGELTDIVNALDILMIAISNQFANFRERLRQINISQIVVNAARKLRGVFFQRFYLFFIRLVRGMNIYKEDRQIQSWSDKMSEEKEESKSIYVGETLNDIVDILSSDLFLDDNSIINKYQVHKLKFGTQILPIYGKENISKDGKFEKDIYDFDDECSIFSCETEKIPQITQTEAFKKINKMEEQLSRLKEDMRRILNLPTANFDSKNDSNPVNLPQRPCSSIDDGISITSSQLSPIISPKISEVKTTFLPPPPPPPLPSKDILNNRKNNKIVVNNLKCKKIDGNVPTTKNDGDSVGKLNNVVLLSEIQNVKLKKVDLEEVNDRKNKKVPTQIDCNDVGSFLQQALYEKFKNTKLESSSNTDSDSELSLWSEGENDTDIDV
uniref:WH2 domain-containing protein n=1 Tax=Strongyloides papillosus TaxID=174720 RepID=A0A0N5B3P3_STREA